MGDLPAGVVDTVDLDDRRIAVSAGRSEILSSPEYDPNRPFDESLRSRIGSYYTSAGTERRRPARAAAARQSRPRAKASATRSRSTRSRSSDEPTKEELYEQARRLDIEGRSKMNKTQLKRAVERRRK